MKARNQNLWWFLFCFLCGLNVLLVFRFAPGFIGAWFGENEGLSNALTHGVERGMNEMAYHTTDRLNLLYLHMLIGGLAMALLPLQLMTRLRLRNPGLHRWLGRVCVFGIVASSVASLPLAINMEAARWGQIGFTISALAWIAFPLIGVYFAVTQDFERHRKWMLYAAAVTFGAVMLRLYIPIFRHGLNLSYDQASSLASYVSLCGNLLFMYLWINWDNTVKPRLRTILKKKAT